MSNNNNNNNNNKVVFSLSSVCPAACKHHACTSSSQCCHDQCLGGCSEVGSARACVACRHFLHGDTCVKRCPPGYYTFKGWRCISFQFCQELHNHCKQTKSKDCHQYVIHNGACIPECPSGYTIMDSTWVTLLFAQAINQSWSTWKVSPMRTTQFLYKFLNLTTSRTVTENKRLTIVLSSDV